MTGAGPLAGLGVVLTRPRAQCEATAAALESAGARVIVFPALDIVPVELSPASRAVLDGLPAASLALFVSANAAEHGVGGGGRPRPRPPPPPRRPGGGGPAPPPPRSPWPGWVRPPPPPFATPDSRT